VALQQKRDEDNQYEEDEIGMPVKMFKKYIGMDEVKDMSKFEDAINQFEVQIEKEGMLITNITMSEAGISGDAFCMVHYKPALKR
jgi:hypothetical protein